MGKVGHNRPLIVMISSTVRDLPEYRRVAMDVCLRLGEWPKMMEHLPALDADAIQASLEMVDEADVYVCILGFRYGSIPALCPTAVAQRSTAITLPLPRKTPRRHGANGESMEGPYISRASAWDHRTLQNHVRIPCPPNVRQP